MLYEKIKTEVYQLEIKIDSLQAQLLSFPEGTLRCKKCGNYNKWYQKQNSKLTYLKKSEQYIAEQLAYKKYLSYQLEESLCELDALKAYIKKHETYQQKSTFYLLSNSAYRELLSKQLQPLSQNLKEWQNTTYKRNEQYLENCIYKSVSGNNVRSKSEMMIDMALFQNMIPYRYECELVCGSLTFYPDFTIRHPKTGNVIYWEHFGMMDDSKYADKTYAKLKTYHSNNIISTINLITTFETKSHPLTSDIIQQNIENFLL